MGLFKQIAEPLIERGVPVIPLRPKTKIAFLNNWPDSATTDPVKIEQWDREYSDANAACVAFAKPDGVWFFEIDRPGFLDIIEKETGHKMPMTFMVRSRPGRGHFYFKHTDKSIAMGNAQAKDSQGELWSARADNRYVVAPGSFHPDTGRQYEIIRNIPIADAPDWLVQWCLSHKTEDKKAPTTASVDGAKIPRGAHDTTLTSIAGKLRQDGLEEESIYNAIVEVCEKRCENYGPDYRDMCRKIAKSVSRYKIAESAPPVIMGGVPLGQPQPQTIVEVPALPTLEYPEFPSWIFKGCHVYDNYIKQVCEQNSRYPEMMFIPALAINLNYLGTKCHLAGIGKINGAMINIIGKAGRVMKSTSVQDMFEYYRFMGVLDIHGGAIRMAEGKSTVWTAGSTEGVGVSAMKSRCNNIILYYDELKTLSDKAGIEGSSMGGHIMTILQSGLFANETKSAKGNFSFDPGSYTASIITCCTNQMFARYWSKLIAFSNGLEDRATLILQPKVLKDITPRVYVPPTPEAIAEEKRLLNKAVEQKSFPVEDDGQIDLFTFKYGNRPEARVREWALAFAVQMGKSVVDSGCIERGIALETYNIQVKKFLNVREAETREAVIQNHIIQLLMQNEGVIPMRDLNRRMHPDRYGTALWYSCYAGLIKSGWTAEVGTGVPGDPKRLVLLQVPESEDE